VDTREKSMARILFGGRSAVTVRELSRLEVREELLPTGARRDVYELNSGGILVNVARQLMRSGDEVIIRTPNAVAAVRGTTVFVQYNAATNQSTIIVLSGIALVQGQSLGANGRAIVSGTSAAFGTISAAEAGQILGIFEISPMLTVEDYQKQVDLALQLANNLVILTGGQTDPSHPSGTDQPPDLGIQGCLDCSSISEIAAELKHIPPPPPIDQFFDQD
jgi:hypothetical protein